MCAQNTFFQYQNKLVQWEDTSALLAVVERALDTDTERRGPNYTKTQSKVTMAIPILQSLVTAASSWKDLPSLEPRLEAIRARLGD